MRINRSQLQAEEKRKKAAEVMASLTAKCIKCGTPGSKRRLMQLDEGPTCSSCIPEDSTLAEALAQEKANKTMYEEKPDAPKPESYGGWA
ncbi:MAG: hypothetical protein RR740_00515 [Pseudomonas sp.]